MRYSPPQRGGHYFVLSCSCYRMRVFEQNLLLKEKKQKQQMNRRVYRVEDSNPRLKLSQEPAWWPFWLTSVKCLWRPTDLSTLRRGQFHRELAFKFHLWVWIRDPHSYPISPRLCFPSAPVLSWCPWVLVPSWAPHVGRPFPTDHKRSPCTLRFLLPGYLSDERTQQWTEQMQITGFIGVSGAYILIVFCIILISQLSF